MCVGGGEWWLLKYVFSVPSPRNLIRWAWNGTQGPVFFTLPQMSPWPNLINAICHQCCDGIRISSEESRTKAKAHTFQTDLATSKASRSLLFHCPQAISPNLLRLLKAGHNISSHCWYFIHWRPGTPPFSLPQMSCYPSDGFSDHVDDWNNSPVSVTWPLWLHSSSLSSFSSAIQEAKLRSLSCPVTNCSNSEIFYSHVSP